MNVTGSRIELSTRVNATRLPFEGHAFDIVAFKSVLGGIGGALGWEGQKIEMGEMHRVLWQGGHLAFAENLTASPLHRFLHTRCVKWAARWRYISPAEMSELLGVFAARQLAFREVAAAFGRREWQRSILHLTDADVLEPLLPTRYRYIALGCATKWRTSRLYQVRRTQQVTASPMKDSTCAATRSR